MFTKAFLAALGLACTVSAHGRLDVVVGNEGGNGTGLGVKGAVIPGGGENYETEPDTTIFWSQTFATDDDDGYTDSSDGNLSPTLDLAASMALAGDTLPLISATDGYVVGNWHVVTDDGCGPLQAAVDSTASSAWATAVDATVTTDLPGTDGNCVEEDSGDDEEEEPENETIIGSTYAVTATATADSATSTADSATSTTTSAATTTTTAAAAADDATKSKNRKANQKKAKSAKNKRELRRAAEKAGLVKRANNVNKSWAYKIDIPSGTTCTGTVNGISNLCQIKVSNNNENGPFGGTFLVQQKTS